MTPRKKPKPTAKIAVETVILEPFKSISPDNAIAVPVVAAAKNINRPANDPRLKRKNNDSTEPNKNT